MFCVEHGWLAEHPVDVAVGSQSCAEPEGHDAMHDDSIVLFTCCTQHTVAPVQFAALLHLSAVVSPPPPPSVPPPHVPPAAVHEYEVPAFVCCTQQD